MDKYPTPKHPTHFPYFWDSENSMRTTLNLAAPSGADIIEVFETWANTAELVKVMSLLLSSFPFSLLPLEQFLLYIII